MEKIKGVVKSVSSKNPGKYGINVNGSWFNGYGSVPANKGDEVEVEFETNGYYKNIEKVTVTKLASATTKEISEDKNASQLTSYAKDLAIVILNLYGKENKLNTPEEVMKQATKTIIESYKEIKSNI